MRRRLYIAGGAVLALAAAFVAGRYSRPARVETRTEWRERTVTKVEYRDRIVTQKGPERIRVVTREVPGGERVVEKWIEREGTTTTRDSTGTATATTDQASATRTVQDGGRPGWSAGISAAWDPGRLYLSPDRYGLELDRRLFGTVWLGARASAADFSGADLRIGLALRMEW